MVTIALSYKLKVHGKTGITTVDVAPDDTLYTALVSNGLNTFPAPCGGKGTCGKCRVKVEGELTEMNPQEKKLLKGKTDQRLACHTKPLGDCELWMETEAAATIALQGIRKNVPFVPSGPVSSGGPRLGIAVDIGTTTVVSYMYDLVKFAAVDIRSGLNAQRAYGADVIARISYCKDNENGLQTLANLIRSQINTHIAEMTAAYGASPADVGYIVIAGNTVMQHIFSALDPRTIAHAPFTPLSLFDTEFPAAEMGINAAPEGIVYLTPSVAGYVGGDITADVLSSAMDEHPGNCLLLDIGTNGEIALGGKNGILCCATAAGPAFEGGQIACGMGGIAGAISRVWERKSGIATRTIGGVRPARGICGSGLVDAIAVLLKMGAIDLGGRLLGPEKTPAMFKKQVKEVDGGVRFYLSDEIFLSNKDVREIQLAKAAIAGGIQTLLHYAGITEDQVDVIYLAGGFGNYISRQSAVDIGLLPKKLLSKIKPIGNSAGMGAINALINNDERKSLADIQNMMKYIELSGDQIFMEKYIENMGFTN